MILGQWTYQSSRFFLKTAPHIYLMLTFKVCPVNKGKLPLHSERQSLMWMMFLFCCCVIVCMKYTWKRSKQTVPPMLTCRFIPNRLRSGSPFCSWCYRHEGWPLILDSTPARSSSIWKEVCKTQRIRCEGWGQAVVWSSWNQNLIFTPQAKLQLCYEKNHNAGNEWWDCCVILTEHNKTLSLHVIFI